MSRRLCWNLQQARQTGTYRASSTRDGGVALVMTLLLPFMMSLVGLAAVLSSSSDMLINGYYRNSRASFYAADSGLTIAREQLVNYTVAQIPTTFPSGQGPMPTGAVATTLANITSNYSSPTNTQDNVIYGGNSFVGNSWKGSFKITNSSFSQQSVTGPTAQGAGQAYQYVYAYSLTSVGMSQGSEQATVQEQGTITINTLQTPEGPQTVSFAAYGMFIDQYTPCSGSYLVPGTITGPVFTNGGWTFGSGAYIFTDTVGSAGTQAGFQGSSSCALSTSGSANGISPTYENGYQWGLAAETLPPDSFNQKEAVVDGLGTSCSGSSGCPSNATMHATLKNISGTAYSTSGQSSGVWIPYTSLSGTNTVTGGGILVEGAASVVMSTANATGEPANTKQVFTITNNSTTTTITIDPVANTTQVVSGSTTLNLAGVPANCVTLSLGSHPCTTVSSQTPGVTLTTAGLPSNASTMFYVDGAISSIQGPSNGTSPAVANGSDVTVTANGDVNITGNILYVAAPVQLSGSGSSTADQLTGYDTHEALGIFTANGNINLNLSTSNQNLTIDASLAAIASGGSGGLVNTGQAINTLTIIGGRIQNSIQNINSTTRNVLFDKRFVAGGFAPPWFPSTQVVPPNTSTATVTSTQQRLQWVSTSSM